MRALASAFQVAMALAASMGFGLGCYAPDYTAKSCINKSGCPMDYYCVSGKCSLTPPPGADGGAAAPRPAEVHIDITPNPSLNIGVLMQTAGFTSNDTPAHIRTLSKSFFLDEREVTVELYQQCVEAGACTAARTDHASCTYSKADKNQPINCVDFSRAVAFCIWVGRRLPTETEWEYAARGPQKPSTYAFGSTWDPTRACFSKGSSCQGGMYAHTNQGAEIAASSPGFYDLTGNVWEWTASEFCPYSYQTEDATCSSSQRVVRGGSGFDIDQRAMAATVRFGNATTETFNYEPGAPTGGHYNLGFRCARDG